MSASLNGIIIGLFTGYHLLVLNHLGERTGQIIQMMLFECLAWKRRDGNINIPYVNSSFSLWFSQPQSNLEFPMITFLSSLENKPPAFC